MHQALLWSQWTANLALILHDVLDPSHDEGEQLAALDIEVVRGPAAAVARAGDRVRGIRLADGHVVPCQHIVVAPRFEARAELLTRLGLPAADFRFGDHVGTHVPADATGATTVPGVWVAGNVTDPTETVIGAAAGGVRAAHAINFSLITDDTGAAVAARRSSLPAG